MARPPRNSATAEVEGLATFQRELRKAGADWAKELRKANKGAAELVEKEGRRELSAHGDPVLRHVAGLPTSLRARGESRFAVLVINAATKKNAMALGAELGSRGYRQFPAYREAAWRGGMPTGGYGAHEAIRENVEEIRDDYGDRIEHLYRRAFNK